jgi:photosystem II stability/assembly factor-like uncharacterized protein
MDPGSSVRGARPARPARTPTILTLTAVLASLVIPATASGTERPQAPKITAIGQPAAPAMQRATGVACSDVSHCWTVGIGSGSSGQAIEATVNGGLTWSAQVPTNSAAVLAAVSCPTDRHCLAVGSSGTTAAVIATTDGGRSWTLAHVPTGAVALTSVECSTTVCTAIGTNGTTSWSVRSFDGANTWTVGGPLPSTMAAPTAITCPTTQRCLVAGFTPTSPGNGGGALATSNNGGASWSPAALPSGVGVLHAVSCAQQLCIAVGTSSTDTAGVEPGSGQILRSQDGGSSWKLIRQSLPIGVGFDVSCPNSLSCAVVGASWTHTSPPIPKGAVVATTNGGSRWTSAVLRYVPVGVTSVTCPSSDHCVGVGGNVLVTLSLPATSPEHATTGTRAGSKAR